MAHKFDHKSKNKLDNEWRRQNLPPVPALEKLGLSPTDIVADIGCGIGYFTVPAAEILGSKNKVFALDTSEEMLEEVEKRIKLAELSNIVTIKTDEYDLKLPDESVTFALIVNVLHEVDERARFIEEVLRILKPEGKIAVIEWRKAVMEMGPPVDHRIGEEEVVNMFGSADMNIISQVQFADVFYGVVAQKKYIENKRPSI